MSTAPLSTSPATLVAILVAARKAGDRELERYARQELEREHAIRLTFARPSTRQEAATQ
jgi:hypothetical protein